MKNIDLTNKTIAISRTDSIGDVILTLPTCAWIKQKNPTAKVLFFGKSYTYEILKCYPFIDEVVNIDEWKDKSDAEKIEKIKALNIDVFVHVFPNKELAKLVKKAKVPARIGTSHRLFHWTTCNIRPNFTRKNSVLHEGQLNFELLRPVGVKELPSVSELKSLLANFSPQAPLNNFLKRVLDNDRKKVVLHTKSQGSAVEWPIEKYVELSNQLVADKYCVYFSGTEKEGLLFRKFLPENEFIIDVSGKSNLGELVTFISKCDVLVACSTGPLHIAAALGRKAIGLYTDLCPMHPGRWAPLGENSLALTINNEKNPKLEDINQIEIKDVIKAIKK